MFENIDFTPGEIIYNDFDIDPNLPLDEENESLKEDMFQVEYPMNYIIDVGWYSGIKKFIIFLIKDCNWEIPVEKIKCNNLDDLNSNMVEVIEKIKNLINY